MKKAKAKKAAATKKKPAVKAQAKTNAKLGAGGSLHSRLEAEFAEAVRNAKFYVDDSQKLRALFQEASTEAASLPRDAFKDNWPYLQAMLRLIRAYYRGEYRTITESTLVVIIAAIIYLVSPLDVIPDAIPGIGFLDDATVLAIALVRTRHDLDEFMIWETAKA